MAPKSHPVMTENKHLPDLSFSSVSTEDTHTNSMHLLELSRLSVNTHTSILNITEDDDEDYDEEDDNFVMESFLESASTTGGSTIPGKATSTRSAHPSPHRRSIPPSPPTPCTPPAVSRKCSNCVMLYQEDDLSTPQQQMNTLAGTPTTSSSPPLLPSSSNQSILVPHNSQNMVQPHQNAYTSTPTLFRITEGFMDSIFCASSTFSPPRKTSSTQYLQLQYDIMNLLGCTNHNEGMTFQTKQTPAPQRQSLQQRALKVHQLSYPQFGNHHLPSSFPQHRSASFWEGTTTKTNRNNLLQPLPDTTNTAGGYDSDPETNLRRSKNNCLPTRSSPAPLILPRVNNESAATDDSNSIFLSHVFGARWTLLWHKEHNERHTVRVWLEQGTLLHQGRTMIEPALCWKPIHDLDKNEPGTTYHSFKLLEITRILAGNKCKASSLAPQKGKALLWRPSCSLVLRACTSDKSSSTDSLHNDSLILEAPNTQDRDELLTLWKQTVARFASLAVMEDMNTMYDEFFVTAPPIPGGF